MTVHPIRSEARMRGARMLRTALGPAITAWLDDAAIIEVMLNPDGRLWIDRLGDGIADTGMTMSAADGERIVRLVAHRAPGRASCRRRGSCRSQRVSAELPESGERFEGLIPPAVAAPVFATCKPAVAVSTLNGYAMSASEEHAAPEQGARAYASARLPLFVARSKERGRTLRQPASRLLDVRQPRSSASRKTISDAVANAGRTFARTPKKAVYRQHAERVSPDRRFRDQPGRRFMTAIPSASPGQSWTR